MLKALIQRSLQVAEACGEDRIGRASGFVTPTTTTTPTITTTTTTTTHMPRDSPSSHGTSVTTDPPPPSPVATVASTAIPTVPTVPVPASIAKGVRAITYTAICASALLTLATRSRRGPHSPSSSHFSSLPKKTCTNRTHDHHPQGGDLYPSTTGISMELFIRNSAHELTYRITDCLSKLPDHAVVPTDTAAILFQLLRLTHQGAESTVRVGGALRPSPSPPFPSASAAEKRCFSPASGKDENGEGAGEDGHVRLVVSLEDLWLSDVLARRMRPSALMLWPTTQSLLALETLTAVATVHSPPPPPPNDDGEDDHHREVAAMVRRVLTAASDIALQLQQMRLGQLGELEVVTFLSCLASLLPLWCNAPSVAATDTSSCQPHDARIFPDNTGEDSKVGVHMPVRALWEAACQRCLTLLPRLTHPGSHAAITRAVLRVTPSCFTRSRLAAGSAPPSLPAYHALLRALAAEKLNHRGMSRGRGGARRDAGRGAGVSGVGTLSLQRQLLTLLEDAPVDCLLDHLLLVVRRAVRSHGDVAVAGRRSVQRKGWNVPDLVSADLAVAESAMTLDPLQRTTTTMTAAVEADVQAQDEEREQSVEGGLGEEEEEMVPFPTEPVAVDPESKMVSEVLQIMQLLLARRRRSHHHHHRSSAPQGSDDPHTPRLFTFSEGVAALTCYAECRALLVGGGSPPTLRLSSSSPPSLSPLSMSSASPSMTSAALDDLLRRLTLAWDELLVDVLEVVLEGLCEHFSRSVPPRRRSSPPSVTSASFCLSPPPPPPPSRVILLLCGVLAERREGWLAPLPVRERVSKEGAVRAKFEQLVVWYETHSVPHTSETAGTLLCTEAGTAIQTRRTRNEVEQEMEERGWSVVVLSRAAAVLRGWPLPTSSSASRSLPRTHNTGPTFLPHAAGDDKPAESDDALVNRLESTCRSILRALQKQAESEEKQMVARVGASLLEAVKALCHFPSSAPPGRAPLPHADPNGTLAVSAAAAVNDPGSLQSEVEQVVAELLLRHPQVAQCLDPSRVLRCVDALCVAEKYQPSPSPQKRIPAAEKTWHRQVAVGEGLRSPLDQVYRHLLELLSSTPNIHTSLPLHVLVAFVLERNAWQMEAALQMDDDAGGGDNNNNNNNSVAGGHPGRTGAALLTTTSAAPSLFSWRQTRKLVRDTVASAVAVAATPPLNVSHTAALEAAERALSRVGWISSPPSEEERCHHVHLQSPHPHQSHRSLNSSPPQSYTRPSYLPDSLLDILVRLLWQRYHGRGSDDVGSEGAAVDVLSSTDTVALLLFFEERAGDVEALERAFTILQTRRLGQEAPLLPRRRNPVPKRTAEAAATDTRDRSPILPAFGILSLLTHASTLARAHRFISASVGLTLLEALESPAVMSQMDSIADLLPVAALLSEDLCVELRFSKRLAAAVQRRAIELAAGWCSVSRQESPTFFSAEPTPREMGVLIGHLICADIEPDKNMLASFRSFVASKKGTFPPQPLR